MQKREAGPHVAAPWGPRTSQFHRDLRMKRQVRPGCERSGRSWAEGSSHFIREPWLLKVLLPVREQVGAAPQGVHSHPDSHHFGPKTVAKWPSR